MRLIFRDYKFRVTIYVITDRGRIRNMRIGSNFVIYHLYKKNYTLIGGYRHITIDDDRQWIMDLK